MTSIDKIQQSIPHVLTTHPDISRIEASICAFVEAHPLALNWLTFGKLIDTNKAVILQDANISLPVGEVDQVIQELKDRLFVIRASDKVFVFDEEILAAKGSWFSLALKTGMQEAKTRVVTLNDEGSEALGDFLHFLQTDEIDITVSNSMELLQLSSKYQVTKLSQLSVEFLAETTMYNNTWLPEGISDLEEFHDCLARFGCLDAYIAKSCYSIKVIQSSSGLTLWAMPTIQKKSVLTRTIFRYLDELHRHSHFEFYAHTYELSMSGVLELLARYPKMKGFGFCSPKGFIKCQTTLNQYLDLFAAPEESTSRACAKPILRALDLRDMPSMDTATFDRVTQYFPHLYYLFLKSPLAKQITCDQALFVSVTGCVELENLRASRAKKVYALKCSNTLQIDAPATCTINR